MENIIQHEKYGIIAYKESIWTGKKQLSINGKPLNESAKNQYIYILDGKPVVINLKGNELTGVVITIENEKIRLASAPKWYEIALPIFFFTLIMAWGTVPQLCLIFPVVGGAIGGAINGACQFISFYLMKKQEKVWAKLLIAFGIFVVNVLICYAVAIIVVSALYY